MARILGIDPGSRITGFGIIDFDNRQARYVAAGCIRTGEGELPNRLGVIVRSIYELIDQYHPDDMAIERVFLNKNVDSALKLGQARGAAIAAVVMHDIPVYEYSATQIKQATVGRGLADKAQVQHMIKVLLQLTESPQADAADALACALCHNQRQTAEAMLSSSQQQLIAQMAGRRRR